LIAVAAAMFALIAHSVLTDGALVLLDARIASWLHVHPVGVLTSFLFFLTNAHAPVVIDAYCVAFAALLAKRRQWKWLALLVLTTPGGLAMNGLIKRTFERARPLFDDPMLSLTSYSFPSGHTAGTVLFYGMLAAYAVSGTRSARLRAGFVALWLTMVILVGFSRVYLGVHYFSDVLGAIAWSIVWLGSWLVAFDVFSSRADPTGHA
jgi:undecaprenyl-diphosphatase